MCNRTMVFAKLVFILVFLLFCSKAEVNKGNSTLRYLYKKSDIENYPFVVSLRCSGIWCCTGSLIASNWVLTTARCLSPRLNKVRFGDMTLKPANGTYRRVLRKIPHPNYVPGDGVTKNDIGLVLIKPLKEDIKLGQLSALDYRTLAGVAIKFAGVGNSYNHRLEYKRVKLKKLDQRRPLQTAKGVITTCEPKWQFVKKYGSYWIPSVCTAPYHSKGLFYPDLGDLGGPVMLNDKIVAVVSGGLHKYYSASTPVSPYLDWIRMTMSTVK